MRRILWTIPVALGAIAAGCATLPDIPAGVCGNHIVDPGEDCDTFAESGLACRGPDVADACRWDCTKDDDGKGPSCPTGYGCGADGVCRAAKGKFSRLAAPLEESAYFVRLADFDGDRRQDVLAVGAGSMRVHYFDDGGALGSTYTLPAYASMPATGRFGPEPFDDLALTVALGVGVLRGGADRTLAPTSYASVPLDEIDEAYILADDVIPGQPGDETLILARQGKANALVAASADGPTQAIANAPGAPSELAGDVAVADVVEGPSSPCRDLVAAFVGDDAVHVLTPCKGTVFVAPGDPQPPGVKLPLGSKIAHGVFALDVDLDGHADLVAGATCPSKDIDACARVLVSFGHGDGTFSSTPGGAVDQSFSVAFEWKATGQGDSASWRLPLAVAQLEDDGGPALVDGLGVWRSAGPWGEQSPALVPVAVPGRVWTHAVIADMNRDGILDVVAGSSDAPGIDFMIGAGGGLFNAFLVATVGSTSAFTVGDFDGDLVPDLAFRESGKGGSGDEGDALSVAFGRPVGALEPPVRYGRFGHIDQIATGRYFDGVKLDAMSDLSVLSHRKDGDPLALALLDGSSDRLLQAPLILVHQAQMGGPRARNVPKRIAAGRFRGDAVDLAVLALEPKATSVSGADAERLWLVPSGADGFQPTAATSIDLPKGFSFGNEFDPSTQLLPVDLDGDGKDELVLPSVGKGIVPPAVYVARANGDTFEVGDPLLTGAVVAGQSAEYFLSAFAARFTGAGAASDLGFVDAVAHADGTATTRVVVFPNDGAGALDVAHPIVAPDLGQLVVGAAPFQADTDPAPELALLTYDGGVYWVDFDPKRRAFGEPHRIDGAPGGYSIAAGDVDGDGIDDLAVATGDTLQLFRGEPRTPEK